MALVTMGDYTTGDLSTDFERLIADKSAQWDEPVTNAQAYKILAPDLARAQTFAATAETMRNLQPGQLAAIRSIVAALQVVRNRAKLAYDGTPNEPFAYRDDARVASVAPLRWLAQVAGHELTSSNDRVQLVRDLWAAPKKAFDWALGLPPWVVPVALGVVGLIVLGQVTGTLKALIPARSTT
jgi:hypothetical protein